ncbi:TRAP transporter large permease [Oscillibacter valericigenes]|jgi:C4-dicarboxylate transporter DctM subunit|uniref:TRAP transporter large permease n=1 Tax=Oscillibacter TaxID=459786 RepID=UPI0002F5AC42|nr:MULTISPECIES: TRAP transporter large permease [Oscillibacter]MDN0033920.1 TRAP transporter large permease [Oscillibacter valericigenes]MEA4828088.1 TRAP transporter large permease [Clostridium sp.]
MTLVFVILFGLMLLGVPVAFAILSSGMAYLATTGTSILVVAQRLIYGLNSFTLLAVPLFILVGNLMDFGGISKRLTDWAKSLLGWLPGGLGIVTVFSCAIFAALTGSGPATVAAIGSIMLPSMMKAGYSKETSAGLVAAAGALGPIIPPSIPMIIYGVTMNLSIPAMFVAGVVPGLVIALVLSIVNIFFAYKNPQVIQYAKTMKFDFKLSLKLFWKALGALGLPVLILGGIYGGIFTPTESAAVGIVYALVVGFALKELKLKDLPRILISSLKTSTMVNFIIAAASLFSWVVSKSQIGTVISDAFVNLVGGSQAMYLAVLVVILLVVGCLMDNVAATLILAPILIPVGISLGCNQLHIGMLFCICLVVGFVTPPFGYNLFTAVSISGLNFKQIVKGTLPFLLAEILLLFVFAFVPGIITWLPSLMGYTF